MAWLNYDVLNIKLKNNPKLYGRIFGILFGLLIIVLIANSIEKNEYFDNSTIQYEALNFQIDKPKIINEQIPDLDKNYTKELKNKIIEENKNKNSKPIKNINELKILNQNIAINKENNAKNGTATLPKGPVENNSFEKNSSNNGEILKDKSQKTLFAIECLKLDEKERPKGCPPSNHMKKMIQFENSPKYNGDNVIGFTNAEIKAKKAAGWRDRCETNEGTKYQVCIPFGKKPPRVKTPYELCIEKGLQGCTRPPLQNGEKSELGF